MSKYKILSIVPCCNLMGLKKSFLFVMIFFIFYFLGLVETSQAFTYYVDKENKFGNGCNNIWSGTTLQPKCDFNHDWFMRGLEPGDEVIVREAPTAGYGEIRLYIESTGTSQSPISIRAFDGEKIDLKSSLQFGIRLINDVSYISFNDFVITNREYAFASESQSAGNSGIKLQNCEIFNTQHGPRWFNYHNGEIRNCEIHDLTVNGVQLRNSSDILIDNVNVVRVDDGRSPDGSDADGFHTYGGENIIISNSTSSYNAEDGFDLNANATLINVRAYNNNGGGLKIWRRVEDNYANKTVTVVNSIFNNNGYYAPDPLQGNPGIKVSDGAGLNLYNSVIYGNYDQGVRIRAYADDGSYLAGFPFLSNVVKNNIIAGTIDGPGLIDEWNCTTDTANLQENPHCATIAHLTTESNNLYFNNSGGDAKGYNLSGVFGNLSLQNAIFTDPLFVNVANNNFHIGINSGARDAGVDLSALNVEPLSSDLDDSVRPQGVSWDIGAYELAPNDFISPNPPSGLGVI